MKNFIRSFLLIGLFLFFTGCIDLQTTVNINPDGSGTIEEVLFMNSAIVEIISQFATSFSDDSTQTAEEFSLFNEDELKEREAKFGTAVQYVSGEKIEEEGKEGYRVVYSFVNVNDLIINQNPGDKISLGNMDDGDMNEEETGSEDNIVFQFRPGNPAEVIINMPYAEPGEMDTSMSDESSGQDSSSLNQVMNFMKDMKIAFYVNLNGEITESNASYVDGSKITLLDFNFADLFKNQEKLSLFKKKNPQSLDELKEIFKDIPGMKMEFNNPVTIKFKD